MTDTAEIRLWVVGTVGIDTITTRQGRFEKLLGGSVTYAGAAASFFTKVGAVGVVGNDFPETFTERYLKLGMDLAGIQFEQGPTFHWEGVYEADMVNRRTICTELGVLENFAPELPQSYQTAPYVLLGNINPDLQLHLLDQATGAKFVAVDSMDLWINCARPALIQVIERSHLLTLNDAEARQLTGLFNLRDCAAALFEMGLEYVLIKKGEHGALLFSREGISIIPAYPVKEVCDPTGAGDTYAGAFMGALAAGETVTTAALKQALLRASAVAAFGVENFSTMRLETLNRAEIEMRAKELREMATL